MLIDWLPPALKRFCQVIPKSSLQRREERAGRMLTLTVENLEERQLLSAANSYNFVVPPNIPYIPTVPSDTSSPTAAPASSLDQVSGQAFSNLSANNTVVTATNGSTMVATDLAPSAIARDQYGRIGVRLTTNNAARLQTQLQSLGFVLTGSRPDLNFIEGFLPENQISQLGALTGAGLLGAMPMMAPVTHAGPTVDYAESAMNSDRVLATNPPGYDGTGVRIGILSDSFNAGGATNLPANQNGDLPSTVTVLLEGIGGSPNEGRAMAELVHDVAPGASIAFASAFYGQASFAQQIRNLANPALGRANIIVDDVGYYDEPFFQDGVIAQAINDVVNFNGVSYFSAAGNDSDNSFEAINPSFVTDATLGAGTYLDFDTGPGVDTRNRILLGSGESIAMALQWDDPFYTQNGVDTDIDIFIIDPTTGQILASSTSNNLATQTPFEFTGISFGGGSANTFAAVDVVIRLDSGPAPGRLKWVEPSHQSQHSQNFQYDTQSSTVFGHAAAVGAMAVAAAPYYDSRNVEPFSSVGSSTILFTPTGSPLGVPQIRQTPDITAIDATNTSFFTGDIFSRGTDAENDRSPNFYGTSAAAPHAAAVAALVKQANPGLSPYQIYDRLTSTATDIGATGVDDQSGYGLIDAYRAVHGTYLQAGLNFSDSFESGALSGNWEVNAQGSGLVKVGSANGATSGTKSFTLDSTLSGADYDTLSQLFQSIYGSNQNSFSFSPNFFIAPNISDGFGGNVTGALSESILHLDLSGSTDDVFLSFSAKQSYDPLIQNAQTAPGTSNNLQEPMSEIFSGSEGSDGVAISTDGGNTWYRLVSLTAGQIGRTFYDHKFNLTEFANQHGIGLGSDVQIKFQQFDALGQIFNFGNGQTFSFFNPSLIFGQPVSGNPNASRTLKVRTNAITIDNVQVFTNQPSTVILNPAAASYPIGAPAINLDANASILDPETPVFDGGSLTIAITQNGTSSDRLEILNQSTIPNRIPTLNDITVSSNRVFYGGVQIGTFMGGSGVTPLVISLNSNATLESVNYLLRDITFRTQSTSLLPRLVQVTVDDGTVGGVGTATRTINIAAASNVAPRITLSPNALNVQPGASATVMDAGATVIDTDSANFAGGILTVQITNNASTSFDRLEIKHQGNGAGQIGFSGSTIKYGGVTIGTLSGGTTSRIITLNGSATPAAVQALIRNITFRTISASAPLATRTVQFKLTDGDGGTSAIASKLINVVKRNQNPTLSGSSTTATYRLGTNAVAIEGAGSVADPDSTNFNGGTLTVKITGNGTAFDKLTIRNQGSNIGQIAVSGGTNILYGGILIGTVSGGNGSSSPLVINFNANANSAAVRALMRNITFQTTGTGSAATKQRTITFLLTDGQGGVSNVLTKSLKVAK